MPTTVGILTFMSIINFMLSRDEPGKSQISLFNYREYVLVLLKIRTYQRHDFNEQGYPLSPLLFVYGIKVFSHDMFHVVSDASQSNRSCKFIVL